MWPAHVLTIVRVPLALAIAYTYGRPAWSLALIAAAAVSDAADGNLARWLKRRGKTTPDIGGWLDPAADKLFVAIVLGAIVWHTRSIELPALIGARELLLLPLLALYLALARDRPPLHADPIGKAATIAQFFALAAAIAAPPDALPVALAAAALGVAAVAHYIIAARRAPRPAPRRAPRRR
jgi:phosphatidylglycerophosphate synthase